MAKQLNKKLVIGLTIGGMIITTVAGIVMVATLPEKDPSYFVRQAREAAANDEHLKASKLYARAWKVSNIADYLVDCGQEALEAGEAPLARKVWTDAVTSNPQLEDGHRKIVDLNLEFAKLAGSVPAWEEVSSSAERLLDVNKKNSAGLYARGLARLGLRDAKPANEQLGLDDLTEAHKLAPENPEYASALAQYYEDRTTRREADARISESEAQQLASAGQRDAAAAKRNEARKNREVAGKDYEEAERLYRNAVDEAAKFAPAAAEAAEAAKKAEAAVKAAEPKTRAKAESEAEKAKEKAKEAAEAVPMAHRNLGTFLVRRAFADAQTIAGRGRAEPGQEGLEAMKKAAAARRDEGLVQIQKATALAPDDAENYLALGDYWVTRDSVDRVLEGPETQPAATTQRIRDDYFKKAEEALAKAIKVGPNEYSNYLKLGALYSFRGDPKRATAVYDQRLDRPIARASHMRWQDRMYKLRMLDQAFRTALQQLGDRPDDKAANESILTKAEGYYRKVIAEAQAGEKDPAALMMKGRLEAVRGNTREAVRSLETAAGLLPPNHPALTEIRFILGDLFTRVGETGAAEKALQAVVDGYPNNDEALARLANVLYTNKNPRAVPVAEQALRINPQNRIALSVMVDAYTRDKNWEKVREFQKRLQGGGAEDSPEALLAEARLAALEAFSQEAPNTERLESAKRALRKIVDRDPLNVTALRALVQLLVRDKQYDESNAVLTKALAAAKAPENKARSKGLEQSLQLLKAAAQPNKSPEEISKATEELIRTGQYDDEFGREADFIQFFITNNDTKNAVEHAKKAAALRPKDPAVIDALFRLALANKDNALAEDVAKKAADANLDGAQGRFYAGRYALTMRDPERAVKEFRSGLQISGTNSQGEAMLGSALLETRRFDEAQAAFTKAVEINPNSALAILGLAKLADMRRQPEAFAQWFARAKEVIPTDGWVQQKMQEEQEARNPAKAIAAREAARKNIPSDPQKVEPAQIDNLMRLAGLYSEATPPQYDKAEATLKEAFEKILANDKLKSREVPWTYANFFREKKDKPDPGRGLEVLKTYAQSLKTAEPKQKEEKAAAQLLVAQYLGQWASMGLPGAPSQADIDAAYDSAVNIADSFEVLMGTGTWYRQTRRMSEAEAYYRKAIQKAASGPDAATQERLARRYLIEALLQARDPERRAEIDGLIAEYIKRFPDDPMGLLFQGQYDLLTGRNNEAINAYSKCLEKDPNNAVAYFRRGLIWLRQEKWEAAIDDLQKAKTLSPAGFDYEHRIFLADAQLKKGLPDDAVNELEGILRDNPDAQTVAQRLLGLYASLRRLDRAEAIGLAARQKHPEDPTWPLRLGQLAEERARQANDPVRKAEYYRTANEHYRAAVGVSKFAPVAVSQLLKSMLAAGRPDDAIEYVTKTLPPDKRSPEHTILLANAYAKKGQPDLARKEFTSAFAAAKDSAFGVRVVTENMLASLGLETTMDFVKKQADAPGDWTRKLALAMLYTRAAEDAEKQNRAQDAGAARTEAEKSLREALAATGVATTATSQAKPNPGRLEVMRVLGQFLYAQKRFDECMKVWTQLLEAAPDDIYVLNNLAYMLTADMNRPKESIEYAKRAAGLAPANPDVLDTYGWNLSLLGKHTEALGPLSMAVDADPEKALARYHRAVTYQKLAEAKEGGVEKAAEFARADAQRAYDLAVQKDEADTAKIAAELLKTLGITPKAPPATAPTAK